METTIHIRCPETGRMETIEVLKGQGVGWCSRTQGKPDCDQVCLPLQMRGLSAEQDSQKSDD